MSGGALSVLEVLEMQNVPVLIPTPKKVFQLVLTLSKKVLVETEMHRVELFDEGVLLQLKKLEYIFGAIEI